MYLCNEKSDKKQIHKDLMLLEPKLQLELIKGYFRGDGHYNKDKKDKRYTLATVSPYLAYQTVWLLLRNYIKPEISKRTPLNRKIAYFLRLWKGDIEKIEQEKIKGIRRTYQHCIKTENYIFVRIKKIIKENYNGKVYNLSVEEDNSYVSNFMAVHNCFPYKISLGNMIESLDAGADTILMYDTCGQCRFKHYHKLQEYTLKRMGYNFKMLHFNGITIIPTLKKLSKKPIFTILKSIRQCYLEIKELDAKNYIWCENKLNIGIIGEIYACCEEKVNYNVEDQIRKLGANCYNTSRLYEFLVESIKEAVHIEGMIGKRKYKNMASKYLNGKLGGHGWENIYNLLWLIDKKVDGIIHVMPLTCMPEATIEPIVNGICKDNNIPLLRLMIDETNSEANVVTRVETFIELIKRKSGINK